VWAEAVGLRFPRGELVPCGVQALPHLRRHHVSGTERILVGTPKRADDGTGVLRIEGELVHHVGSADLDADGSLKAHDGQQRSAREVLVLEGILKEAMEVGIDDPRGVIRTFDIATDPEEGLGEPGKETRCAHC
jgi:hypothetical protein